MINKHENICVGVWWDDVSIPSWKLSGWYNTRAIISSKICKGTVKVHSVYHDIYVATNRGGQRQAVVCYSMRLHKSEGPMLQYDNLSVNTQNCDEQTH